MKSIDIRKIIDNALGRFKEEPLNGEFVSAGIENGEKFIWIRNHNSGGRLVKIIPEEEIKRFERFSGYYGNVNDFENFKDCLEYSILWEEIEKRIEVGEYDSIRVFFKNREVNNKHKIKDSDDVKIVKKQINDDGPNYRKDCETVAEKFCDYKGESEIRKLPKLKSELEAYIRAHLQNKEHWIKLKGMDKLKDNIRKKIENKLKSSREF